MCIALEWRLHRKTVASLATELVCAWHKQAAREVVTQFGRLLLVSNTVLCHPHIWGRDILDITLALITAELLVESLEASDDCLTQTKSVIKEKDLISVKQLLVSQENSIQLGAQIKQTLSSVWHSLNSFLTDVRSVCVGPDSNGHTCHSPDEALVLFFVPFVLVEQTPKLDAQWLVEVVYPNSLLEERKWLFGD